MSHRRKLPVLPALLYICLFAALCMSGRFHAADSTVQPLFARMQVRLSGGDFYQDSSSLTVKLQSGDIPMLSYFTQLQSADFSGSACYEDIVAWAEQNPQVSVLYSVTMPDGSTVRSDAQQMDLSGLSHGDVEAAAAALKYLPMVSLVELGQVDRDDGGITLGDMALLSTALPDTNFSFSLSLLGREIQPDETDLDLTGLTHSQAADAAAVLSCMNCLKNLRLGQQAEGPDALTTEDLAMLGKACPSAVIDYSLSLYGVELNLNAKSVDLRTVEVGDKGQAIRQLLPCMRKCTKLDMDATGVPDENMAQIRDENPGVEVIWRIWFGELYSVRTDATRILASKPTVGGMIYDADVLKYCTKMKYLDLGHNDELSDISFVRSMPELEVFIIAMTNVSDLSPLESCPKLEYLELNSSYGITDLSPLKNATALRHLNIGDCLNLDDISPLFALKDMQRLWIGCNTPIPAEQVATMKKNAPGCTINTTTDDPHMEAWRYTAYDPDEPKYYWVPRHELLREQMGYNYQEYSFYWLDPLCEQEAPDEYRGMFGKEVYGLSNDK